MSDTPRTDDLARGNHVVPAEWAQQLERERDEERESTLRIDVLNFKLRKELDDAKSKIKSQADRIRYLEGATNHAKGTPLSVALRERDEAREVLQAVIKTGKRLERERDEAREHLKLSAVWQSLRDSQDEVLRLTFENRELSQGGDVARGDQENSRQSLAFALEELEEARNEILGWKNKWTCAIDMAARAELERDQLKEMPPQLLQAECRAERFCQGRDDLRAAIKQALPFFKWILETMNPPFDFDKFADASVAYEQLKKAALPSKPKPANRHLG